MELLGVLLAVCGLSVVCIGLVAIVVILVIRSTGRTLTGTIGPLFSSVMGVDEQSELPIETARRAGRSRPSRAAARDWQSRAQSLDFDAAVSRHREKGGRPPAGNTDSPVDPDEADTDDLASGSLRYRRDRRAHEEFDDYYEDDEGDLF
jgi:hypothetical protein